MLYFIINCSEWTGILSYILNFPLPPNEVLVPLTSFYYSDRQNPLATSFDTDTKSPFTTHDFFQQLSSATRHPDLGEQTDHSFGPQGVGGAFFE